MPRGFLVKRFSKTSPAAPSLAPSTLLPAPLPSPPRVRRYSDEDRSDTSSDHELLQDCPSDVLKSAFCGRPPPLRPDKISRDEDTLSPTFSELSQDVPLALTTGKANPPAVTGAFSSLKSSVFFLQRHEHCPFPPATPPPPLKPHPARQPHSAPAAPAATATTTLPQAPAATPKSNSCQPPKKRVSDSAPDRTKAAAKRAKVVRRLNFDEDKTSPVSGTFIRDLDDDEGDAEAMSGQQQHHPAAVRRGDIDPSLNVVVVTEEARAELAKIENRIGDYVCRLCREHYEDAFGLAQHRCSRIVHVEYRCPECDKVFNCPANLASHRRWHKPRPAKPPAALPKSEIKTTSNGAGSQDSLGDSDGKDPHPQKQQLPQTVPSDRDFECHLCRRRFGQYFHFRKHLLSHLTSMTSGGQQDSEAAAIQSVFSKSAHSERRTALARLNVTPPPENDKVAEKGGFPCSVCGLAFQSKSALEEHAFQHDELKGIQCKYCPSVFYSSAGLTRHINKHHPSENRQVLLLHVPSVRPLST